jgi:hypothetical protein
MMAAQCTRHRVGAIADLAKVKTRSGPPLPVSASSPDSMLSEPLVSVTTLRTVVLGSDGALAAASSSDLRRLAAMGRPCCKPVLLSPQRALVTTACLRVQARSASGMCGVAISVLFLMLNVRFLAEACNGGVGLRG